MGKHEFQSYLKNKIKEKRFEYLSALQAQHSKTRRLAIEDTAKPYFSTNLLSTDQKRFLFRLRCNMTAIKSNFKQRFSNLVCRLCLDSNSEESLTHFSVYSFVMQHIPEVSSVSINDIYRVVEDQARAVKIIKYIEEIENNQVHACASCIVLLNVYMTWNIIQISKLLI